MQATDSPERAAQRYAARGIAVLPLHTPTPDGCTCHLGNDCTSAGKHPRLRHGLHEASTDPRLIRSWWRRWPTANIGLATGTSLDVCDIDSNDGLRTILDLLDVIRPDGPLVRTGDGWHLWYAPTGLPSRTGILPAVDWRARGGIAVAPPSLHATGRRYTFTQPWTGQHLPPCPPALRGLAAPPPPPVLNTATPITDVNRYTAAALDAEIARILHAPRPVFRAGRRLSGGGRNSALNRAAFRLGQLAADNNLPEHHVRARLADAATTAGLSADEAHRTITSGWRAGFRCPRLRP